jgi:hypothetical protein
MANGRLDREDPAIAGRLFAGPFMGLIILRMMGDEHIAANWDRNTETMGQFLRKAFQKSAEQ